MGINLDSKIYISKIIQHFFTNIKPSHYTLTKTTFGIYYETHDRHVFQWCVPLNRVIFYLEQLMSIRGSKYMRHFFLQTMSTCV